MKLNEPNPTIIMPIEPDILKNEIKKSEIIKKKWYVLLINLL